MAAFYLNNSENFPVFQLMALDQCEGLAYGVIFCGLVETNVDVLVLFLTVPKRIFGHEVPDLPGVFL